MKKVKWVVISSLVLFLFLPGILNAEEIGILPFRTTGVENYITETFYDLLESELDYYDHKVVSPYEIEHYLGHRVICYNKDYAADYGRSLGLEKVIFGSITRLDGKYIISVEVVKSRTGEILLRDIIDLESEEHLEVYVYSLAESIEEEVYENVIYYDPHYSRTYTYIYIGTRYPRRVIWRRYRPHRSLITVRLPLININLGKSHHIVNRTPSPRKPVYQRPSPRKPDQGRPNKGKSEHGKQKNEKTHGNNGGNKKGKR